MIYYLDTSALVKRYVDEIGSDWLRTTTDPAQFPLLFTSRMTIVETISAFARRVRENSLTLAEFATLTTTPDTADRLAVNDQAHIQRSST